MNYYYFDPENLRSNDGLDVIFQESGSDKDTKDHSQPHPSGWSYHSYAPIYSLFFNSIRHDTLNLMEVGIGTTDPRIQSSMGEYGTSGASLRAWKKYFTKADIVGLDIDEKIMFTEERIETFCVDQTDPISISKFISNNKSRVFDVIIDDGLHTENAAHTFFENSFHLLKPNGFYFIEDAVWIEPGKRNFLDSITDTVSVFLPRSVSTNFDMFNKLVLIQKRQKG
jgi:hypothetical protein